MSDIICLDKHYSTTRILFKEEQVSNKSPDKSSSKSGGLQSKGYSKRTVPGKPLISVITVVFNGQATLEKTILSVIGQTYDNVEYLIIDGGSTDSTCSILAKHDSQIDLWISEKDHGIYDAINKGIKLSHGDWVYVLGADDILLDSLREIAKYLKDFTTVYYGDVYCPGLHCLYDGKFTFTKLIRKNICHQSIFYPKRVYEIYTYNQVHPQVADYELTLKVFGDTRFTFAYIPVCVAIYNDRDGASKSKPDIKFAMHKKEIIKKNYPRIKYYLYKALRCFKVVHFGISKDIKD